MSVTTTSNKIEYNCDGSIALFPITYPFIEKENIVATLIEIADVTNRVVLILDTDYTIDTGNVDYRYGANLITAVIYGAEYQLEILRDIEVTQETVYNKYDAFNAEAHEKALDKLTMINQQQDTVAESNTDHRLGDGRDHSQVTQNEIDIAAIASGEIFVIENIAELATISSSISTVNVRGYYTAGDGGGGIFNYDASFIATNNGGTIINGWVRQYSGAMNVCWFGADKTGTIDSSGAFQNAVDLGGEIKANGEFLINLRVDVFTDLTRLDLTGAVLLNTVPIATASPNSQLMAPLFYVKANNVRIINGEFRDLESQGIYVGGVFAGASPAWSGNTYANVEVDGCSFYNIRSETAMSMAVQARHVDNVQIKNISIVSNGRVTGSVSYDQALTIAYGINGLIENCTCDGNTEGGAVNFLYVSNGKLTDNSFYGMANAGAGINMPIHIKQAEHIVIEGNYTEIVGDNSSDQCMKISEGVNHITIAGNDFIVTGNPVNNFCTVQIQGAEKFLFSDNIVQNCGNRALYLVLHSTDYTRNGVLSGNKIENILGAYSFRTQGSGIFVNAGSITTTRDSIVISNNFLKNADIYMFQALNSEITNNTIINDIELFVTTEDFASGAITNMSAMIMIELCDNMQVTGNSILNALETPAVRQTGIRLLKTQNGFVFNNNISYINGSTLAYGVFNGDTSYNSIVKGNEIINAVLDYDNDGLSAYIFFPQSYSEEQLINTSAPNGKTLGLVTSRNDGSVFAYLKNGIHPLTITPPTNQYIQTGGVGSALVSMDSGNASITLKANNASSRYDVIANVGRWKYEGLNLLLPMDGLSLEAGGATTAQVKELAHNQFNQVSNGLTVSSDDPFGIGTDINTLLFDGANDDIVFPSGQNCNIFDAMDDSWTFSCKVKFANAVGSNETIITKYLDANNYWRIYRGTTGVITVFVYSGGVSQLLFTGTTATASATWYQIDIVKVNGSVAIYIDHLFEANDTMSGALSITAPVYVGQKGTSADYLAGKLSDMFLIKQNLYSAVPSVSTDLLASVERISPSSGTLIIK